jgi:cytochrome c
MCDVLRQLTCMRPFVCWLTIFPVVVASMALAADVDKGKQLAQARCALCHDIQGYESRRVSDALPFELIARKFADNPEVLAFWLLAPHPRMNEPLTRREAQDIAAYMNTLGK